MSDSKPSKNAFKHGLYSEDVVVLDCESKQEFAELRDALLEEYAAHSVSEKIAVSELANLFWKKRRLESRLKQALEKRLDYIEADVDGWDHDPDARRSMVKSHSEAAQIVCDRTVNLLKHYVGTQGAGLSDSEAAEFSKFLGLAGEMQTLSNNFLAPIIRFAEERNQRQIEQSFDPDLTERALKIEAEIDRRIEKVLKRLAMTKQYKEFYVPKCNGSQPLAIKAPEPNDVAEKTIPKVNSH